MNFIKLVSFLVLAISIQTFAAQQQAQPAPVAPSTTPISDAILEHFLTVDGEKTKTVDPINNPTHEEGKRVTLNPYSPKLMKFYEGGRLKHKGSFELNEQEQKLKALNIQTVITCSENDSLESILEKPTNEFQISQNALISKLLAQKTIDGTALDAHTSIKIEVEPEGAKKLIYTTQVPINTVIEKLKMAQVIVDQDQDDEEMGNEKDDDDND